MSPAQGQQLPQLHRPAEGARSAASPTSARSTRRSSSSSRPSRTSRSPPAEIDAQVTKDATTPESRHTFQIQVTPETSTGATEPTAGPEGRGEEEGRRPPGRPQGRHVLGGRRQGVRRRRRGRDERRPLLHRRGRHLARRGRSWRRSSPSRRPGYTEVIEGADGSLPDRSDDRDLGRGRGPELHAAGDRRRRLRGGLPARRRAPSWPATRSRPSSWPRSSTSRPSSAGPSRSRSRTTSGAPLAARRRPREAPPLLAQGRRRAAPPRCAADDPAWAAAEEEATKAYDELKAGTARFVDLAPGERRRHLGRRERLPAATSRRTTRRPSSTRRSPTRSSPTACMPGQLLAPVKSAFGWHVIEFVTRRRSRRLAPRS